MKMAIMLRWAVVAASVVVGASFTFLFGASDFMVGTPYLILGIISLNPTQITRLAVANRILMN